MKLYFGIMVALITVLLHLPAHAQEVIVEGQGPTQQAALQDSFRAATEKVVGLIVDSRTYVRNAQVIRDQIYARSDGYVRDYTIMNERWRDNICVLRVKVDIDTSPRSDIMTQLQKLKTVEVGLNDPRIGIVILNQVNGKPVPAAQTAVTQELREAGFSRIIDVSQLDDIVAKRLLAAVNQGDASTINILRTQYQLDYLVVGKIITEKSWVRIKGTNAISARSSLDISVFKCDTAEIVCANQFQEGGADIGMHAASEQAAFSAGQSAGQYLAGKMLNYGSDPVKHITLYIHNVANHEVLQEIERSLSQTQGVGNVYTRNFSERTAVLDINFSGSAQTLATYMNDNPELNGRATSVTNSTIDFKVIR